VEYGVSQRGTVGSLRERATRVAKEAHNGRGFVYFV
jgi:hypothetical protein